MPVLLNEMLNSIGRAEFENTTYGVFKRKHANMDADSKVRTHSHTLELGLVSS